jgi:AcrR family transcriptional regulator
VHAATVRRLAGADWATTTLAAVARDAGVQPSSLYRRWGSLERLLGDVVETLLAEGSPLPDTGSLAEDLHRWATAMAADLAGPHGQVLVRVAVLRAGGGGGAEVPDRVGQIEALLDAARARGEATPSVPEVFELLVAPLYGYAIFAPQGLPRAPVLARRLLDLTRRPSP